jgi:PleD family two-component response regulator
MIHEKSHALSPANSLFSEPAVASPLPISVLSNKHHSLHVLVAEDDPINSQVLGNYLKRLGHTVVLTTNGEECAKKFSSESHVFDIVLTDIQVRSTEIPLQHSR